MRMKRRMLSSLVLALAVVAAAIVVLVGTRTSPVLSSPEGGMTRIIHASPDSPPIDLLIDDTEVFTDVAFGDITDYIEVSGGTHSFTLQAHSDQTPLLTGSVVFTDSEYTLAAAGMSSGLELIRFVDDNSAPGPGMVRGRLVHLSPGAPAVDVAIKDGDVLFSNLGYKDAGDYVEVAGGTYELEIRLAGTKIVLGSTSLTVGPNNVYSMFAIGTPAGLQFVQTVDKVHGPIAVALIPESETVTAGECVTYTLMAEDIFGNTWDATENGEFGIDPEAGGEFAGNVYKSEATGTWAVTGTCRGVWDDAELTVQHGEAVTVDLIPDSQSVTAGDSVTYTLLAEDSYGNTWDVTAEAEFSIDAEAGGEFDDNVYTSESAGTWIVSGSYEGLSDEAELVVHYTVTSVSIAPRMETVTAGECVTYTLTAEDNLGGIWDVTSGATLDIDDDAGGTWIDNVYCSKKPGDWTVTGMYQGLQDEAQLTVKPAEHEVHLPLVIRGG